MKQRLQYFDIAKGIAIILVILGHNEIPHTVNRFIFSFHMPLFFIVSGYFFKPLAYKEIVKKGWRQLLVPYLFTGAFIIAFFALFQMALHFMRGASYDAQQMLDLLHDVAYGGWPVWFLLALFVAKIVLNLALSHERYALSIVLAVATIGYVWGNYVKVDVPLQIFPGFIASLFLYIGYQMRKHDIMAKIQLGGTNLLVLTAVAVVSSVTVSLAFAYNFPERLFTILSSTSITVIVLLCCKWLEEHNVNILSAKTVQLFSWIGRYTLVILSFHSIEMALNLWKYLHLPNAAAVITLKVVVLCALPLLVKRIPILRNVFSISVHR